MQGSKSTKVTEDWDMEQYRLPWESAEQWEVRHEFMLTHQGKFKEDRLVCLGQVYANIEFLGCSYPAALMKQIANLSEGLSTTHREKKQERDEIKFVKAAADKAAKKADTGVKRKFESSYESPKLARWESSPSTSSSTSHLRRSNAASYFNEPSTNQYNSNKYQTQNYYTTSNYKANQSNVQQFANQSSWNSAPPLMANEFQPEIMNYGGGRGRGDRGGRERGGSHFSSRWTGHHSGQTTSRGSNNSLPSRKLSPLELALDGFVILESANGSTAVSRLSSSAQFSKKTLKFVTDVVIGDDNVPVQRCAVQLESIEVAAAQGTTKAKAKIAAAEAALHILSSMVSTLKVKQTVVSDGALSRDGIGGSSLTTTSDEKIGIDNVGNKLLRNMGWSGGGLGKLGREGITEPIKAEVVYGRQGFGSASENGISKEFLRRFTNIVADYARTDMSKDLVFTPEFTKEERAEMHKVARRFRLKSTGRGKGDDRFIVISRRFGDAQQVVRHVVNEGGSTEKYELIPPGRS